MKKIYIGLVFLIIFSIAVANTAQAAPIERPSLLDIQERINSQLSLVKINIQRSLLDVQERISNLPSFSRVKVGANLKEYRKPHRSQCDINVPKEYPTIQSGINAALPGDTVCVGSGIYNEGAEWAISINKPIRLSGNGFKDSSIINFGSAPHSSYALYIYASDVIVEGFVINGSGGSNPALLIAADSGQNITIQYNRIEASEGKFAMRSDSRSSNYLIKNNIFVGSNSPTILALAGSSTLPFEVSNNTFIGSIDTENGRALTLARPTTVERNVFEVTGGRWLVDYGCSGEPTNINYNNFISDANYKVRACDGEINAENNWWGDLDPADNVLGAVDYEPFATKPFRQY